MDTSMLGRINALRRMTVGELRIEWQKLYNEPSRSRNKQFLYRRLAWRIQELRHGGLSAHAQSRIDELAPAGFTRAHAPQPPQDAPERVEMARTSQRDPRLPSPGTVVVKAYKGRELRVVVREDGVEYDGAMHASLTALAKHVTGCRSINGRLFWGLSKRKRT